MNDDMIPDVNSNAPCPDPDQCEQCTTTLTTRLYWIALGLGSTETAADLKQQCAEAIAHLGYNPLPEGALPC